MLKEPERVIVCRVEHRATGLGPYRPDFLADLAEMHHQHTDTRHPAPHNDDMDQYLCAGADMLFGFKDMEQLDTWFEPQYKHMMHNLGFIIREYEVPIDFVEFGGHQVAFDHEVSELRGEKNLVETLVP